MITKIFKKQNATFLIVITLLTYFLWEIDGKYGFNPSDEARVLGMVQRIFNGEVPHRDFMYQTLVGSAYLHFFHYFMPIYNLQFQRIVVILMFQIYSLALLNLSNKYKNLNLPTKVLIFAVSTILNMHYFEFTIWPTVDGIFVLAIGSYLIFKSKKYTNLGFLLIGLAPLMKTPFLFSTIFIVIFTTTIIYKFSLKNFLKKAFISAIPSILYLLYIFLNGGFSNFLEETLNQPSNSFELVNSWIHHLGFYEKTLIPISFVLVLIFTFRQKNRKIHLYINLASFVIIVALINSMDFASMTYKPIINLLNLFFIFIFFVKFYKKKYPDTFIPFFVCYVIEFAAIMSIGWRWGLFVSGTVLVLVFITLYESDLYNNTINFTFLKKININLVSLIFFTVILFSFAIPVQNLLSFKSDYIYRDKPKEELNYNLNNLNTRYGNVYTSDTVYKYLESIQFCLEKYDSKKVSIFPDNPALYFIYDLENPIPIDWYTAGVEGKVEYDDIRIKEKMKNESYKNSFVFLQSYKVSKLMNLDINEINSLKVDPFPEYVQGFYENIYDYLKDRESTSIDYCQSFTVLVNK